MRECSIHVDLKGADGRFDEVKAKEYENIIQELNIKYINTYWNGDNYFEVTEDDREGVQKIAELCERNGVQVSSFHFMGAVFDGDDIEQKKCRKYMQQSLDLYAVMKPRVFVLHPGTLSGGRFAQHKIVHAEAVEKWGAEKVHQLIVENIRWFGERAREKGIALAVENIFQGRFYSQIDDLIQLVSDVNSDNVGYCFDCGHGNVDHVDHVETIHRMGNKLFELHLHDNNAIKDQHLPIGFGTVNWLNVIQALNDIGYDRTATFEFFRWPLSDRKEGIAQAMKMWNTLESVVENGYSTKDWK